MQELTSLPPSNRTNFMKYICEMIKVNESDVRNIDFELQAKRGDNFLCFTLFISQQKIKINAGNL